MWKLDNNYSVHHILPRSQHGSSEDDNLEILKNSTHRSLHTLFQNKMIAEQLLTTISLSEKALREDIKEWLIETLTSKNMYDPYTWYKDTCIK